MTASPNTEKRVESTTPNRVDYGVLFVKIRDVFKCDKKYCLSCLIHLPNRKEN